MNTALESSDRAMLPSVRQLPLPTRRALAISLAAATIAYCALLFAAYLQLTPSSSVMPDIRELARLLFEIKKPISRIERLLEATDGPMSRSGTMRPAFTDQSLGWESITQSLTAKERAALLVERDSERLAMLDWVRMGASREAYENDRYSVSAMSGMRHITTDYLIPEEQSAPERLPTTVRIRTLLRDRCVTCHGENGRHDISRFIELDAYDGLAPHLKPEPDASAASRVWLFAALLCLYPLAAFVGPVFLLTNHPPGAKRFLFLSAFVALVAMAACWLCG
ncbi:MAG: hypothetical protein JF612_01665, partial [Planctomycetia bacterium]|nr:hypothetical protein [Planctomycetia bacterium]